MIMMQGEAFEGFLEMRVDDAGSFMPDEFLMKMTQLGVGIGLDTGTDNGEGNHNDKDHLPELIEKVLSDR